MKIQNEKRKNMLRISLALTALCGLGFGGIGSVGATYSDSDIDALKSRIIELETRISGDHVLIGKSAVGYATGAITIGNNASTVGSVAVVDAIAIGTNAQATLNGAVAIGSAWAYDKGAFANGSYSLAIMSNSESSGSSAIAIGQSASATKDYSVALGKGAQAAHANSVALGDGSVTGAVNTVSVGSGNITDGSVATRKITNVTAGAANTDAATYGQLIKNLTYTYDAATKTIKVKTNEDEDDETTGFTLDFSTLSMSTGTTGDSLVIGNSTKHWLDVSWNGAIDSTSVTRGENSVAYGYLANANSKGTVAIGYKASAGNQPIYSAFLTDAEDAIAIGNNVSAVAKGAIVIGASTPVPDDEEEKKKWEQTSAQAIGNIVIGYDAHAEGGYANVTGKATGSILIGYEANSNGVETVAIGNSVVGAGGKVVAVGSNAETTNDGAIAIGYSAKSAGGSAVAIGSFGYENTSTRNDPFGTTSSITRTAAVSNGGGTVALGAGAQAGDSEKAEAAGSGMITYIYDTAVGTYSTAIGGASSAFGRYSYAGGIYSIAMGSNTSAYGNASVSLGAFTGAKGEMSLSVGVGYLTYGTASGAIGVSTVGISSGDSAQDYTGRVWGEESYTLGNENEIGAASASDATTADTEIGNNTFVIGNRVSTSANNAYVFGSETTVVANNSVVLGENSESTVENTVSVGRAKTDSQTEITRRIMNVGDGQLASDAATYGQIAKHGQTFTFTKTNKTADILDTQGKSIAKITIDDSLIGSSETVDAANKANIDASNIGTNLKGADGTSAETDASKKKTNLDAWGKAIGTGKVEKDSDQLVTGSTIYDETRKNVKGTYISSENDVGTNLSNLDAQIKKNTDAINQAIAGSTYTGDGTTIQVDANTRTISAKTGDVSSSNNGLVTGATVYQAVENAKVNGGSYTIDANNRTATVKNNDGSTAFTLTVEASAGGSYTAGDNINISNDNTISVKTDGAIEKGNTGIVTGGTIYEKTGDTSKLTEARLSDNLTDSVLDVNNRVVGMSDRLDSLSEDISKVGAGAAALAALHPEDYDPNDKMSFAVGLGHYKSATAGAIGAFYKPNQDMTVSFGYTIGNGNTMMNLGFSFKLGARSKGVGIYTSNVELVREVNKLRKDNERYVQVINAQAERIASLEAQVAQIMKKLELSETVEKSVAK